MFQLREGEWQQITILERPNLDQEQVSSFGQSLAVDEDTLMVGAPRDSFFSPDGIEFGRAFSYDVEANAPDLIEQSCFVVKVASGSVVSFCL